MDKTTSEIPYKKHRESNCSAQIITTMPEKEMRRDKSTFRGIINIFIVELICSLCLIFFGCLSLNHALVHLNNIPYTATCLTFGIVVMVEVATFGHISGAHINPIITLSALINRMITWQKFIVYTLAHFIGAVLGYMLLRGVTPNYALETLDGDTGFCVTVPANQLTNIQAVILEFMGSFLLVMLFCGITDRRASNVAPYASLLFGFAITGLALSLALTTGASLNPARSFAPAFCTSHYDRLWIYFVAPYGGSLVATIIYKFILSETKEERRQNDIPLNADLEVM